MIGLSTVAEAHPQVRPGPPTAARRTAGPTAGSTSPRGPAAQAQPQREGASLGPCRLRRGVGADRRRVPGRPISWPPPMASTRCTARAGSGPGSRWASTSWSPSLPATSPPTRRASGPTLRSPPWRWTVGPPVPRSARRPWTSRWRPAWPRPRRSPSSPDRTVGTGPIDTYAAMVDDRSIKVITTSWGQCEGAGGIDPAEQQAETTLFDQAAAQGQTVMAAAGDSGSSDCYAPPHDVNHGAVGGRSGRPARRDRRGGTTLTGAAPDAPTETVWNDGPSLGAGGGGNSADFAAPSWQQIPEAPDATRPLFTVRAVGEPAVPGGARRVGVVRPRPRRRHLLRRAVAAVRGHQRGGTPVGRPHRRDQPRAAPPRPGFLNHSSTPPVPGPSRRSTTSPSGTTSSSIRAPARVCALPGHRPLRPGLGLGQPTGRWR